MTKTNVFLVLFAHLLIIAPTQAKVLGVVGEKLYECEEIPKNQQHESIDFTNFKIHHENDTHTYLDGNIKFLVGFSRLPGRVYLEHYVRGKWIVQIFDRTYFDLCLSFHNPAELFFNQTKTFPSCPIRAGSQWDFDMVHIRSSDKNREEFPPHLTGLWRMTIIMEFFVNGQMKKVCRKIHCDIYEV